MTDTLIGTELDEYRLESLLGQGGMARVYRGLDMGLQRYAAIKVIDTPHQQDESYMARFEREARAIAQLDHPHIVTVYRYGRAKDRNLLYLAMKYIEGADLHGVLAGYEQDGQLMPFDEVTRLIREIGSALDYAHSQGVVHRDIKPSNVMLDEQGRSYITDFGLALLADVGTRGEILGSPNYIAPEQAVSSAGAVPQSDLYALGVILFRMITGQLPFNHEDVLEMLMLHMTAVPPNPRDIRPDISPALADVILKALAKEPNERYASGKALADALEAALKDTAVVPVAAPTLTIMDRVALDKETLPPIPAAATPQITKPQATASMPVPAAAAGSPAAQDGMGDGTLATLNLPVSPKMIGAGVALLLVVLVAFLLLRNRGDAEPQVVDTVDSVPAEGVAAETAVTEAGEEVNADASPPAETPTRLDDTPTVVAVAESNSADDPTAASEPETVPQSTGTLYLPVIMNDAEQAAPIAAATATALPPATEPPVATATIPPPTATPSTIVYQLLIATNKEDSLFVVNQSGANFPLNALRLGKGNKTIEGTEWAMSQLAPGSCVTAWKDSGNPKSPDVACDQVGTQLVREGKDRFWKDKFDIFYNDEKIGACDPKNFCLIEITP